MEKHFPQWKKTHLSLLSFPPEIRSYISVLKYNEFLDFQRARRGIQCDGSLSADRRVERWSKQSVLVHISKTLLENIYSVAELFVKNVFGQQTLLIHLGWLHCICMTDPSVSLVIVQQSTKAVKLLSYPWPPLTIQTSGGRQQPFPSSLLENSFQISLYIHAIEHWGRKS